MAKKRMKIGISEIVEEKLSAVHEELVARGAQDFDLGEILSELVQLPEAQEVIDRFVCSATPEAYKVNELLNMPGEREKVLELLKDKSFGIPRASSEKVEEAHP